MATYNLDALTGEMPTVKLRGRSYTMRPLTPADFAEIQRYQRQLGAVANAWIDDAGAVRAEYNEALAGIVTAVLPGVRPWQIVGGYKSRVHRWLGRRERGLDLRMLAALVQVIYTEIANLLPGDGDLKNARAGAE